MKVRPQHESKRRGRGRPRRRSVTNTTKMDRDNDQVIVIDSSSESQTNAVMSLLDTTTESINSVVEISRAMTDLKNLQIVVEDLKHKPGVLTAMQKEYLLNRSRDSKDNALRVKKATVKKRKKKEREERIAIETISISSATTGSDLIFDYSSSKKKKKCSHKSKSKSKEARDKSNSVTEMEFKVIEPANLLSFGEKSSVESISLRMEDTPDEIKEQCDSATEIKDRRIETPSPPCIGDKVSLRMENKSGKIEEKSGSAAEIRVGRVGTASAARSGEKSASDSCSWRMNDKSNESKEKSVADCASSIASNGSLTTKKRKRRDSDLDRHSFYLELNESGQRQRERNSAKRRRTDSSLTVDNLRVQLESQRLINRKADVFKESARVDCPKLSKNGLAQSIELTDTVDDPFGKKSALSGKENIVARQSVAEKPATVNNVEHCYDRFCPINGDFRTEGFSGLQPFLDCEANIKMINLEINANGESTLFSPSDTEADQALDKEPCTLDSISRAIDNDLAAGNQLMPMGSIDCTEMINLLPHPLMSEHEENRPEDTNHRLTSSSKSHENFDTSLTNSEAAAVLGNGNESMESNENRKHLAIIEDDTFPKGTIELPLTLQTIRENRKRKRPNQSVVTPVTSVEDNQNLNDAIELTIETDENLLSPINELEIEALLNESPTFVKDDHICEDALNNNREKVVTNKNEVNSEKQRNMITVYSAPSSTSHLKVEVECKEFNALKSLLDEMNSDNLANYVETPPEFDSINDREIDEALEQFTNTIAINLSKSDRLGEVKNREVKPVGRLTVQNLDKFNSSVGNIEARNKTACLLRRQTIDTEASSNRTHHTGGTNDSARIRKRKWAPTAEKRASSQASSGKIKLNRKNWGKGSQDSREKSVVSDKVEREIEQPIHRGVKPEAPLAKIPKIDDKKNDTENPVIVETVSVINELSRKLMSPITNVVGSIGAPSCSNGIGEILPGFGGSSVYNVVTSTPTKEGVLPAIDSGTDDSSSSSSSDSSSGSSSSSSSSGEDSSDESEDEDIPSHSEIHGEEEMVSAKIDEESRQSDSGIKSPTQTTEMGMEAETLASFGAEADEVDMGKAAGSLIEDGNDPYISDEDDKSDAISLYTESLCMSRCASPERQSPPKRFLSFVSSTKEPKSSNVRSRLGPRIDVQTEPNMETAASTKKIIKIERAANNVVRIEPAANNVGKIEHVPNKVQARLAAPNVDQICPEAAASNESDVRGKNVMQPREVEMLFRGACFGWLRNGACKNELFCRFVHDLQPQLRAHIHNGTNISQILIYAICCRYRHFIQITQKSIMSRMTVRQIINFCIDLCTTRILTHVHFVNAIDALREHSLTLVEVVDLLDHMMPTNEMETPMRIIESLFKLIEPGYYWETLKKLLTRFSSGMLPIDIVTAVLDECVRLRRDKLHADDVYDNLVSKLPSDIILAIGHGLVKAFYDLRNGTVEAESNDPPVQIGEENVMKSNWTCSIASPDSPRESIDFPLKAQWEDRPTTSSPIPIVQPQNTWESSKPSTSTGGGSQKAYSPMRKNSYNIKPLDKLPPPKSPYGDTIWRFHLDLKIVQDGLKHHDYDLVIKTLAENQNHPNRLPHIAGFYNILCKEIMLSRHHLEEIVRRTVQSGASDELRRFVYDLGVFVLTTLADTGTWVIAYELLKTFKVYGQYNTCAFTLLSAEIYIANHRPLKALAVLKQCRLIFTNPRMWNQMWCSNDEPLRISVIELLMSSLCDGYAEHAFSLLDFIIRDQCSSVKPINISRYVDRVARVLLAENRTSTVVDLGRLIIQSNLLVTSKVFRALINGIFHSDQLLAKQLHRYATCLGTYNMPKISGITHMIVNIDWTEEEMYLMFSSLLYELYMNIGHAIDRLRPRQLAVYLILETVPTERQLLRDVSEPPLSNAEIAKRRTVVKKVFGRFDPKIKIIQKAQGRLCKIRSESLVDYLKAGHFKS